jgi:glycerol uptake facilitator-like aquaporin
VPGEGRFAAGTVLADRFRIVGLIGRGGMGEVYRADDLKLGHPVALKFLPAALASDGERLTRFLNEVRVARQIAHPNVCRVYDVGDLDGDHYLSMEFVDGEDLASLLRRIGRLAGDKALDIARQLCAGLSAAHDRGVLHRDLKPENVMLDGRGKVRITDFGLAAVTEAVVGAEARSGTPAYMSPEQLSGREATLRSDIYALGLVLYELFTGKRAFGGRTLIELVQQHQEGLTAPPSSIVSDLDPAIERVILRCVEEDPGKRPPSALAVAAALPGGDPLAAALAAGETPSPELVAAAQTGARVSSLRCWTLLGFIAAGVAAYIALSGPVQLLRVVPFEKPPAVLEDRARSLLEATGLTQASADSVTGFWTDEDYFRYVEGKDKSSDRWKGLASGQPPAAGLWYRQSPRALASLSPSGRVSPTNPPIAVSGMAGVFLDSKGRLMELYVVPPQRGDGADPPAEKPADWTRFFAEAGLDPAAFHDAAPQWTPPFYCNERVAWEGTAPGWPGETVRVEAGTWLGRPTWFQIVAPWTRPERMSRVRETRGQTAAGIVGVVLLLSALGASILVARRNVRLGRGDRRGAARIALFALGLALASWGFGANHVPDFQVELGIFFRGLGMALINAAFVGLLYLALEPFVRRLWPDALISWTRLLSGRTGDPLVGAHLLVGSAYGVLMAVVVLATNRTEALRGVPPSAPAAVYLDSLLGLSQTLSMISAQILGAILSSMAVVLLFVGMRRLLRKQLLAAAATTVLMSLQGVLASEEPFVMALLITGAIFAVPMIVLVRQGLLAVVATMFTVMLVTQNPLTPALSHWTGGPTRSALIALAALTLYAFKLATARSAASAFD